MSKRKFRLYYSTGVTFDIEADECAATRRGGRFEKVNFTGLRRWACFSIDDLVAIVEQPRR